MLSQSRTTSSRRGVSTVLVAAKLKNRKSTKKRSTRGRVDAQEEYYKGIHDRFLGDQVYRESQLQIGWTEQKCVRWTNWHSKITRTVYPERNSKDTKGQWYLTLNKSGKNTPMRLRSRSHNHEPPPPRIKRSRRTHSFSTVSSDSW